MGTRDESQPLTLYIRHAGRIILLFLTADCRHALYTSVVRNPYRTMRTKTIDQELNRKLRDTLELYKKIESPFLGLFLGDDVYARPPFFAFRFKNGTLDDYKKIKDIIDSFNGTTRWTMSSKEGFKNHMIEPNEFKKLRDSNPELKKDNLLTSLGEQYYDLCDKALDDVQPLCHWIQSKLL